LILADAAVELQAADPVLLDVQGLVSYADYLLVLTGTSVPHVQALADALRKRAKENGIPVISAEGEKTAKWALLDFGDVVVHVFQPTERGYYDLEGMWGEVPRVTIPGAESAPSARYFAP
jgi:ribosome silencing factor RsfS/YbeB/iojap